VAAAFILRSASRCCRSQTLAMQNVAEKPDPAKLSLAERNLWRVGQAV
jgi:hypothetical protein